MAKINLSSSSLPTINHWLTQRGFESDTPDTSASGVFICDIDVNAHTLLVGCSEETSEVCILISRFSEALKVETSAIIVKSAACINIYGIVRLHRNLRRVVLFGLDSECVVLENMNSDIEIVKTYDLESLVKNPGLKRELWVKVRTKDI